MNEQDRKIKIGPDDIEYVWQLAAAITPLHRGDFVQAFADAMFQRNRLITATRASTGGLRVSPPDHPPQHLVRDENGQWWLLQEG